MSLQQNKHISMLQGQFISEYSLVTTKNVLTQNPNFIRNSKYIVILDENAFRKQYKFNICSYFKISRKESNHFFLTRSVIPYLTTLWHCQSNVEQHYNTCCTDYTINIHRTCLFLSPKLRTLNSWQTLHSSLKPASVPWRMMTLTQGSPGRLDFVATFRRYLAGLDWLASFCLVPWKVHCIHCLIYTYILTYVSYLVLKICKMLTEFLFPYKCLHKYDHFSYFAWLNDELIWHHLIQ